MINIQMRIGTCDGSSRGLNKIKSENMFESIDYGDWSGRKLIASKQSNLVRLKYIFIPDGHFVNFVQFLAYFEKKK